MKKLLLFSILFLLNIAVSLNMVAQRGNATIKGTVIDVYSGEPLIGTNVAIQGTSLGTSTNLNGEYTIPNIPAGTVTLVYRYIGYKQIEERSVLC